MSNPPVEPLAFSSAAIGVADLDIALDLWVNAFGLSVLQEREGDDEDLAKLWKIQPADIRRQVLLATNDHRTGMLHIVEFRNPGPAVRANAAAFDLCPKNIDIYVQDLPNRVAELRAAGRQFRNDDYSQLEMESGSWFREIHMPVHDDINIVLLEVEGAERPHTDKGYGAVGPLIYTVPDSAAEKSFIGGLFRMEKLHDNILQGPEVEKMIGLPGGAKLDVSVWGSDTLPLGKLELVEYTGVSGANLYPRACPPSTGVLHISFAVPDLSVFIRRLHNLDTAFEEHGVLSTLLGTGPVLSLLTPAGLRIDLQELSEDFTSGDN